MEAKDRDILSYCSKKIMLQNFKDDKKHINQNIRAIESELGCGVYHPVILTTIGTIVLVVLIFIVALLFGS